MLLAGQGFVLEPALRDHFAKLDGPTVQKVLRPYVKGGDLIDGIRETYIADLFGISESDFRAKYPNLYQYLLEAVRYKVDEEGKKMGREWNSRPSYKENWWIFAEPRSNFRPALVGLGRYLATTETSTHRHFQFLDGKVVPDHMVVAIASDDHWMLGLLSSRVHCLWALRTGGMLGVGDDPRYSKSLCFDKFPFPDCSHALKAKIRAIAEELDAHRKARQAEHARLTLTQMYNVLEKLRAPPTLNPSAQRGGESALTPEEEDIKQKGLVLILKELHDKLDALVFEAYGWAADLGDDEILKRLVDLNKERALEEKAGKIRWLRPDYQIPSFGSDAERARLAEQKRQARELKRATQTALDLEDDLQEMKPKFPTGKELEETAAVMRILASATTAQSIEDIARTFAQGKAIERRVELTLSALMRLGHLVSNDGGKTLSLRRVK